MKKWLGALALVLSLSSTQELRAQEETAKKAANKTAEIASKGKSKVVNTKSKDKIGPNGETVYVNKYGRYYWIDKKGRKLYLRPEQLKDKPVD